jgi:catechol 2,3-dioxygenase-like lactoylglutathione lyase family enzyme
MMLDPFDALHLPIVPIEPRPEFAADLLRRIQERAATDARQTATVRYFVADLDRAVEFYCRQLDFEEELRPSPTFATLYRGDLRLLLSVPGGSHTLPDGTVPEPGGWNRISLQVADLATAVEVLRAAGARFRCQHLGFQEVMHPGPGFAMLVRGDLRLVLSAPSGPNTGGGSVLADGRKPEPGGWNRFAVEVSDVAATVQQLRAAGVHLRSDVIVGTGGKQALVEDPSGNPIELFEPIRPEARLTQSPEAAP